MGPDWQVLSDCPHKVWLVIDYAYKTKATTLGVGVVELLRCTKDLPFPQRPVEPSASLPQMQMTMRLAWITACLACLTKPFWAVLTCMGSPNQMAPPVDYPECL